MTLGRWWIYQRERFPVAAHGPLIAAFSLSAVSYSALVRGETTLPVNGAVVAFVTAFLFFLQLRIADEFKDHDEDARYRPYRPVPRGLVKLRELAWIGVAAGLIQLGAALAVEPRLLPFLLLAWIYLALMSAEFFVPEWLKARPLTYMWSHMLIMPLIDFYATACEWRVRGADLPEDLAWFLLVSFCNGCVIEIGRKLRAPQDEEAGVETYTALWGRANAVRAWLAAMAACAACALMAAHAIRFLVPAAIVLAALLGTAAFLGMRFVRSEAAGAGRRLETISAVWTLSMYLVVGVVPLALRAFA
jgi:4-hydroxybenzoate polyprenyltransferase